MFVTGERVSSPATVSKKFAIARAIIQERDAYGVKDKGSSFKPSAEWEAIEDKELELILIDKFTRNPYCRDFLLATGGEKTVRSDWRPQVGLRNPALQD